MLTASQLALARSGWPTKLTEASEAPHQDSQHHNEDDKAADGDHEGNLPAGATCLFGTDGPDAQQDK
jgi:hypothetical protein